MAMRTKIVAAVVAEMGSVDAQGVQDVVLVLQEQMGLKGPMALDYGFELLHNGKVYSSEVQSDLSRMVYLGALARKGPVYVIEAVEDPKSFASHMLSALSEDLFGKIRATVAEVRKGGKFFADLVDNARIASHASGR